MIRVSFFFFFLKRWNLIFKNISYLDEREIFYGRECSIRNRLWLIITSSYTVIRKVRSIQNIRIKNIFNYINNIMKNNFIRIIFCNISQSIKVNLSFSWFNRKKIQFPILFIIFRIEIKILSFISYLLNFNIEDFKSNLNFLLHIEYRCHK